MMDSQILRISFAQQKNGNKSNSDSENIQHFLKLLIMCLFLFLRILRIV